MERKYFTVQDTAGNAVRGASVLIKTFPGGVNATLYSDDGVTTVANPMTTNVRGECFCNAANGHYTKVVSKTGIVTDTDDDIVFFDPDDYAATLAATTGSGLVGWIRSAVGAVATTIAGWLGWQPLNLLEFMSDAQRADYLAGTGAVAIDDALDKAFAAIEAKVFGGRLYAPAGKGRITSTKTYSLTKFIKFYGDGKATKFFGATGFGALFNFTITNNAAHGSIFQDFMLVGAASGTTDGMALDAMNVCKFNDIWLQSQGVGISAANTYAAEFNGIVVDVCASDAIKFTTSAHGTIIRGCNFYTCGVSGTDPTINFTVSTNNIVIDDNSFEDCYKPMSFQDCTSISINKNYIEYSDTSDIDFLGTCRGVSIEKNWIGLGAATLTLANLTGATFKYNTVYNQTVALGSNVNELECASNPTLGSGAVNINYMASHSVASGSNPYYAPDGPDANIQGRYSSKGAADVAIYTGTASILSGLFAYVAGAVNWLKISPNTTGLSVTLTAESSVDSNVSIRVFPKGTGDLRLANGNFRVEGTGNGVAIKAGTNCKLGTVELVAGTATVNNTSVTAASYIRFSLKTAGGTIAAPPYASTITAGTSFVVTAGGSDTSTYIYEIVEPL